MVAPKVTICASDGSASSSTPVSWQEKQTEASAELTPPVAATSDHSDSRISIHREAIRTQQAEHENHRDDQEREDPEIGAALESKHLERDQREQQQRRESESRTDHADRVLD